MGLRESNKEDLKVYDREAFRQTTFHDSYDKERVSKWKHKQFLSSLEFAVTGLMTAFREERNMKKHLVIALLVLIAGVVFQVSTVEWLFLLASIFLVFVAEVLNSAVENLVDLICGETFSPFAKNAKDMAAGAVLLCSIYATLVGLLVFMPKVLALLF